MMCRAPENCQFWELSLSEFSVYFIQLCACVFLFSDIYKHLLSDRQFGLTHNLLATKVMPSLIPHSVDPGLSIDQVRLCSNPKSL